MTALGTTARPLAASPPTVLFRRLSLSRLTVHAVLLLLVAIWTVPTLGLFISSLRDKEQLSESGWWTAFVDSQRTEAIRLPDAAAATVTDGTYLIEGDLFGAGDAGKRVAGYGLTTDKPDAYAPGSSVPMADGGVITVRADGSYTWTSQAPFTFTRAPRLFVRSLTTPRFTLANYAEVLTSEGVGRAFINTATVAIPATIIPITIATFAAYALAWMRFPQRRLIAAAIIALLVVPLQMSLIPLLSIYNALAHAFGAESGKTYLGVWLAHTAFGLPFAIYLLRNYMVGLPRELFESAHVDGATHIQVFTLVVLPLCVPAIASLAIFQFLWVWNDLLVATVFLGNSADRIVLTNKLINLLGSRGTNWEILTAGAFVTIIVPLIVFFALQRHFVRGILAGSGK